MRSRAGSRGRSRIPWDEPESDWSAFERSSSARPGTTPAAATSSWPGRVGRRRFTTAPRWSAGTRQALPRAISPRPGFRWSRRPTSSPATPRPSSPARSSSSPRLRRRPAIPAVSARRAHDLARALIAEIQRQRADAMVQPYLPSVDSVGRDRGALLRRRAEPRPAKGRESCAQTRSRRSAAGRSAPPRSCTTRTWSSPARRATPSSSSPARSSPRSAAIRLPAALRPSRHGPRGGGEPTLLELEAIEPNFYLDQVRATDESSPTRSSRRDRGCAFGVAWAQIHQPSRLARSPPRPRRISSAGAG